MYTCIITQRVSQGVLINFQLPVGPKYITVLVEVRAMEVRSALSRVPRLKELSAHS